MLLKIDDITVHYGRLAAVRGVSIGVDEGEIVCIVGPNGAGKSTTLLTVAGALSPSSGSVTFDGKAITGARPEAIARLGFSMVPEGRHVFATLTVEENLRIGSAARRERNGEEKDFRRVLEYFP
jgi:branched-chain amino acid transport system ATP-binding protein